MAMDAKKRAALILAVPEEQKEAPEKEEELETPSDRLALAKHVIAALKSGDAKAFDAAFADYLEACDS